MSRSPAWCAVERVSGPLVLLLVMLLAGCQLVDSAEDLQPADPDPDAPDADTLLGSPEEDFPSTLAGLQAYVEPEALTWQDAPRLVDVTVWLERQEWTQVRATYVAAEADRLLTVRATPERLRVERPLLEGLQLPELPPEALQALGPLPEDVLEPAALAAAAVPALRDCDAGDEPVRSVLYATGAPGSWDGERWTATPDWRATVVTDTVEVVVQPDTGRPFAPLECLPAGAGPTED